MSEQKEATCVVCQGTDKEKPIVVFRYQGKESGICTDCLPTMIHRREMIMEKLSGEEKQS